MGEGVAYLVLSAVLAVYFYGATLDALRQKNLLKACAFAAVGAFGTALLVVLARIPEFI